MKATPNSNKSTSPSEQSSDQYDDENDTSNTSMMNDDNGLVQSPSANNNNDNDISAYGPTETAARAVTGKIRRSRMRSAASAMPSPCAKRSEDARSGIDGHQ